MFKISRTTDSPKKRKENFGISTWSYVVVDTLKEAEEILTEWKAKGFYVMIEEVKEVE